LGEYRAGYALVAYQDMNECGLLEIPVYIQSSLVNAEPPFNDVDMIVATHEPADHFGETMICQ